MYHFDASALVYFWDNYPIHRPMFNEVWQWFDAQVSNSTFQISDVALQQVKDKILYKTKETSLEQDIPESKLFIQALNKIKVHNKTGNDLNKAEQIKQLLGIEEDNYGNGVDEADLLIVAIAFRESAILITNESEQERLPQNMKNCKMPAVCNLNSVNIDYIDLRGLLHHNI